MTSKIGGSIAKGAAWMLGFKLAEQGIGMVSMVILARLLMPEDFGLVAMAMVLYALLELLGAMGSDIFLIQKKNPDRHLYDTAWTVGVIVATVEAILLAGLARPAAIFYEEPRLEAIAYCLAFALFIGGYKNIGVVAFRKEMEFHKEFIFMLGRKIAGFLVTVPLAFALRNYWALIAGIITANTASLILSYLMHRFRPHFSLTGWREIYHFSKWLYINNFLFFLGQRAPEFLLGKMVGAKAVGLFNIGYEVGTLPLTALVAPINRAVFPGYAKIANNPELLKRSYLDVAAAVAIVALPAGFGIAAVAELLVPVVLGNKWIPAVPIIQMLAITGALGSLLTNAGAVYLALGKPHYITALAAIRVALLLPAMYILTTQNGVIGAAWAALGTAVITAPVEFALAFRTVGVRTSEYLICIWRSILGTAVMYGAVRGLITAPLFSNFTAPTVLLVAILLGFSVYILSTLSIWAATGNPEGIEATILKRLFQRDQTPTISMRE